MLFSSERSVPNHRNIYCTRCGVTKDAVSRLGSLTLGLRLQVATHTVHYIIPGAKNGLVNECD